MTTANLVENAGINPREAEILQLMIDGCTNRQMAATLFISESTVKKYVNAIYHKPGVSNRMGLAAPLCCHRRLGLIPRTDAHDIRTTLKKGGLLLGYNPRAPGSRLKARARTSSRPSAS